MHYVIPFHRVQYIVAPFFMSLCFIFLGMFSLQHLCRLAIRRQMGVARRRRLKELPLPPHLISYLCSLPVSFSDSLHDGWMRTKSGKDINVKNKHTARRPKTTKYVGIHQIRQVTPPFGD